MEDNEEEINNLRKLYFLRWTGSQAQFAFENKLNYRNFSRWLIGKRIDRNAVEAVKNWLNDPSSIRTITIIKLIDFLPTLRNLSIRNNIKRLIFMDTSITWGHYATLNWIFSIDLEIDFLFVSTIPLNTNPSKGGPNFDWIIHITPSSLNRDSVEFSICSQMNQAYTYYLINNRKIEYNIVVNNVSAPAIKSEFEGMDQDIESLDHIIYRIDLYLITLLKYEQLSPSAQYIKNVMSNMTCYSVNSSINLDLYPDIPLGITLQDLTREAFRPKKEVESVYSKNTSFIRLIDFLPTLKDLLFLYNINRLIFIDADQYDFIGKRGTFNWIFNLASIESSDIAIFLTTSSTGGISRKVPKYDWIIHLRSNSSYKDAADFAITSQMSQAYTYLLMNNMKLNYTIMTNDKFALALKAEYE